MEPMTPGMLHGLMRLRSKDPGGLTARGMGVKTSQALGLLRRGYVYRNCLDGERDTYWLTNAGRQMALELFG